ncbi:polysaccharide lyase family 1 protein [Streptomyces turgidiscabies]|uniref:Tat pathway signal sequence domain protein n=1 Tax=Streptomyces turgidiscabies (strain Car8) TaxID=698760 RepID=L7EY66_STRT8|nr:MULTISPECIES: Tat pathway signal sequence domain protein [Streptomyces]ELP63330.1 Tat pathway signal sequence domain protein [Streptomyces turgidiscabies Car8]MDX3498914.1 pectate lyase [Streptomyces turgidiscabies]GAQ77454.1 pectate lyase precursor [Streptomyces turgidiscabies]
MRRLLQVAAAIGLLGAVLSTPAGADARDLSRDTLPANDGWAAAEGGTTGGAAADDAHVFTVRSRGELVRALDGGSATPKIIRVAGTIDANTADDGDHVSCGDYADGTGYTVRKYLAAYDPRTWGSAKPAGAQEEARQVAAARQAERVVLPVGSNTTILGLGSGAVLKGASLQVRKADNVIVRNLELRDAYDCFPVWQPNSGGLGDWKTAYDTIWLNGATHVWVDHVTASDKGHSDADEPTYFARNYLRHDGLLDITNASDLVTVSWSRFADHDKAMLIGSGDTATGDRWKLRVTLHHNEFRSLTQRAPRVRFGQVHVYNNRYLIDHGDDYRYSIGVSTESAVYAENNAFTTPGHVEAADLVKSWNGTALHQTGTLFNGFPVDLLTIYNAYNSGSERDLTADVGWTPTLHTKIDSADTADREVARGAGAGRRT